MSVGNRQLVLMTFMALHDGPIHPLETRNFQEEGCEHPKVERRYGNKIQYRRACHCWTDSAAPIESIFTRLEEKGMIRRSTDDKERWELMPKGWELLDKAKKSPVRVTEWSQGGYPIEKTISISRRKQFRVLDRWLRK